MTAVANTASNANAAKTVLITGATSGIGKALAERYHNQGFKVNACGRNLHSLADMDSKGIGTMNFDITDSTAIHEASTNIESIDLLILNAGDCRYIDDVKAFDSQLFSHIIDTNLKSLGCMLEHFLPKVKKGGQVAFISSSATILPFPKNQAYGASKAGMDYLAKSLRLDLAKHKVDVSLVHPGFVSTPLTDKNNFDMPFIIPSEEAASRIYNGLTKRKKYIHFPKRLTLLLKLFAWLPPQIWHSIMTREQKA